jgi:hypothetical protein
MALLSNIEIEYLQDCRESLERAREQGNDSRVAELQAIINRLELKAQDDYTGITTNANGTISIDHTVATAAAIAKKVPGGDYINYLVGLKKDEPAVNLDKYINDQDTGTGFINKFIDNDNNGQVDAIEDDGLSISALNFNTDLIVPVVIGGGAIALMITLFKGIFGGK